MGLEHEAPHPTLHVFIIYASRLCSHTTLRLWHPDLGAVFWDPAGSYGKPEHPIRAVRQRDLVVDPVPSVADYIAFRDHLPTASMEIFEFKLEDHEARHLINVLRDPSWPTRSEPFQCSSRISEFLHTHGGTRFRMDTYFFPHSLSAQLYSIGPDRLLLLTENGLDHHFPPN